jgi:cobalt/nickel transport system permease protein
MHLAEIDHYALNGSSMIHKAQTASKAVLAVLLLSSIIISQDIYRLLGVVLVLLGLFLVARIPIWHIGHLALYPAFFSIFFAILTAQQSWVNGLVIMTKAVGAALTMLLLITTTPYVDLFALFSLFMPSLLVDIFLMTYRSFFILLDKISQLIRSIRIKGGYTPWQVIKNFRTISAMLGTLIIQSFEMSERMYRIYELRGYNGKIPIRKEPGNLTKIDFTMMALGLIVLIGVVLPWEI